MAIGDTDIVICNKALTFLAADPITSFSDGTASADACNRIYKIVKESTIGMYPWSFTLGKQTLARETTTPTSEWSYQFILPNDMVTGVPRAFVRVLQRAVLLLKILRLVSLQTVVRCYLLTS